MAAMLSIIQNNYTQHFPREVPLKATQAFLATTAIFAITGSTASVALVVGTMALTATLIEAVIRPILSAVFRENFSRSLIQGLFPIMVVQYAFEATIMFHPIAFILSMITWIGLNHRSPERNEAIAFIL